jgi:hypothetical protein
VKGCLDNESSCFGPSADSPEAHCTFSDICLLRSQSFDAEGSADASFPDSYAFI